MKHARIALALLLPLGCSGYVRSASILPTVDAVHARFLECADPQSEADRQLARELELLEGLLRRSAE